MVQHVEVVVVELVFRGAHRIEAHPLDRLRIVVGLATAASGLVLAVLRSTPALPLLLALHLGIVAALFATLPYGKFAHGVYRVAALFKWAIEKRRPVSLKLGSE